MEMHGLTNPKFINAKQAGDIYSYRNVKRKLHKTIAGIWFNKTCREKEVWLNYINMKINGNNRQCNNTMTTGLTTTNSTATTMFLR
jgi:hypothetical protein